jgi:hypothetical protein
MLIHEGESQTGGSGDRASGGIRLTSDQAKQRGLSGAVTADDPPLLASGYRESHVSKQRGSPELNRHTGEGELGHRPVHSRQMLSASPSVSCDPCRTSGIRRSSGSATSRSRHRSSLN